MKENQPALDATLNIVGTLVSILLGLLVAASLNNYQTLESAVDSEAISIAEVCRLSFGLPNQERKLLLKTCLDYCDLVVSTEWPAMQKGQICDAVLDRYATLLKEVVTFAPKTAGETNIQAALITSMQIGVIIVAKEFFGLIKAGIKILCQFCLCVLSLFSSLLICMLGTIQWYCIVF